MKRIMAAEYPGECADCGTEIAVRDMMVWDSVTSETWCVRCKLPREGDLPVERT